MEDPVLQISLKFQRNSKQAYDCTRLLMKYKSTYNLCPSPPESKRQSGIWSNCVSLKGMANVDTNTLC
jgi:hypothetical protein